MRYKTDSSSFLNEDDISYYLLGAYMSDGTVTTKNRKRFEITSKDNDWIKNIRDIISPHHKIYKSRNINRLAISNKQIVEWLIKQGCVPNKSKTLQLPQIPSQYFADFVRGYFDGDGSVGLYKYKKSKSGKTYHYKKFNAYICSGSQKFITTLNEGLKHYSINGSTFASKSGGNYINGTFIRPGQTWRLSFGGKTALQFTNWTHYDGHKISLSRKFNIIKEARKHFTKLTSKELF